MIKYTCFLSTAPCNTNSCLCSKKVHDKTIFRLLKHLQNQINLFPHVSIHSMSPAHSLVPLSVHTVSPSYFRICVSYSRMARPHGMWHRTRFTHFVHNTQYSQTSQLSICHHSVTIVSTSVTLLLAMLLLTLFSSVHVQKVFFLVMPAWQCSVEGKCSELQINSYQVAFHT